MRLNRPFEPQSYLEEALAPDEERAGYVLTCQTRPTSKELVVDFDAIVQVVQNAAGFRVQPDMPDPLVVVDAPLVLGGADLDELLRTIERTGSTNNIKIIKALEGLKMPAADRLQLVSDLTPGWRMSELLEESAAADIPVDITVAVVKPSSLATERPTLLLRSLSDPVGRTVSFFK